MFVYRGFPSKREVVKTALTIGNFDGVHIGHRALLARLVAVAKEKGLSPAVLTFEPHPREFFDPANAPPRLSSLREKLERMAHEGIEQVFVCRFNASLAAISAEAFIERIVLKELRAAYLTVGGDFRFGADRAGNFECLRRAGAAQNFEVEAMPPVTLGSAERVSSSSIRDALQAGRLSCAETLLGRPYSITGRVVHGRRDGHGMGAATANIGLRGALPPLLGVFAISVRDANGETWRGVANLGFHPSVGKAPSPLLETHVFDFSGDLYGRRLTVSFMHKLRDEIRFSGIEDLKARIALDIAEAKRFFQLSS